MFQPHGRDRNPRSGSTTTSFDYVTANDAAKLQIGQAHYSGLLYEHGGFVDDILVHKVADDHYFLCVNASNQEKDFEHISTREPDERRSRVRERPLRADRGAGTESAGDRCRSSRVPTWPASGITGSPTARFRGFACAHRPYRIYRRGRIRDLHGTQRGAARSGTN